MTNTVAAVLAALLIAGAIADAALNDAAVMTFLALELVDLLHWMAFWR
ncbi:MAG: hypothetical protein ACOCTP_04675 [Roseicyclus sp.]